MCRQWMNKDTYIWTLERLDDGDPALLDWPSDV